MLTMVIDIVNGRYVANRIVNARLQKKLSARHGNIYIQYITTQ